MDFVIHGLLAPDAQTYIECLTQYCPEYAKLVSAARAEAVKGKNADKAALTKAIRAMLDHPEALQCQFRRCVRTFEKVYASAASEAAKGSVGMSGPAPKKSKSPKTAKAKLRRSRRSRRSRR